MNEIFTPDTLNLTPLLLSFSSLKEHEIQVHGTKVKPNLANTDIRDDLKEVYNDPETVDLEPSREVQTK